MGHSIRFAQFAPAAWRRSSYRRRSRSSFAPGSPTSVAASERLESRELLTAVTIEVAASQDSTIYDVNEQVSNGAGEYILTGATSENALRGLVQFDLTDVDIPAGSTIVDVVLTMNVAMSSGGSISVALETLQTAWGEAGSDAVGDEIIGAPAQAFDATWAFSQFDGNVWQTPGGDSAGVAGSTQVGDAGAYEWFGSGLISDVQTWLDNPAVNHGWLITTSQAEGNVKSFYSRDSGQTNLQPILEITYDTPELPGIVTGRKWHDLNGDGLRTSTIETDLNLAFPGDDPLFNAFGGNEYWYFSRNNRQWYYLLPDGSLHQWSGDWGQLSGNQTTKYDARVYHNPETLLGSEVGPPEPWMNGFTFELVDEFGTVIATTESRDVDFNRDGFINPETETGWYRFEDVPTGDYRVREVPQNGWKQSASSTSPLAETAALLDSRENLRVRESLFENYGGLGEKWLRGDDGWFYITPAGDLFEWDGVSNGGTIPLNGTLTQSFGQAYFRDPSLLHAAVTIDAVVTSGSTVQGGDFGNYQPAEVSGRKWHDRLPDGQRLPTVLQNRDGLIIAESRDVDGLSGNWFEDPVTREFFVVREDGSLAQVFEDLTWEIISSASSALAAYPEALAAVAASGEEWLNGWQFELLDEAGNVLAVTTSADVDRNGDGEIAPEQERGWYVFDDLLPGTYDVREIQQPDWIQVSPAEPTVAVTAAALQAELNFQPIQGDDWFDFGGRNERWLQDAANRWYFITPDGTLYEWDRVSGGSNGQARGTEVAQLNSAYFLNPDLFRIPGATARTVRSGDVATPLNFGNHHVLDGLFSDLADELLG